MKVFCMDTFTDGHHCAYIKGLCANEEIEFVLALPQEIQGLPRNARQYQVPYDITKRSFGYDMRWLKQVLNLVKKEQPDVVHFLYGDLWYRYFGFGLSMFRHYKTVLTFHVVLEDKKHQLSVKFISHAIDTCVVHTERLLDQMNRWGISNAAQVEYPCFLPAIDMSSERAKKALGIPTDAVVFGCLGGTRRYKGLDFFMDALKEVEGDFHLLVAGTEEFFSEDFIRTSTKKYADQATLILHQLSDDEFVTCILASDWIALPYRKEFTGASGPLAEGVMYGKKILGTNTGSIGDLIQKYDLGLTFENENVPDLTKTIQEAIQKPRKHSERYLAYQTSLLPETFAANYRAIYDRLCHDEDRK